MRPSKHSFMLSCVLLMLLVGPVACLQKKPEADDDKQEVDVTDSGERAEVHNRELSRSGWAMTEAPAMFDVRDKKEKHNRNRRRKSTSGNFGPGSGKKSDIVHSTSFGKEVSEDNKTDKGRTLMLLDREADASGANRTAVGYGGQTLPTYENPRQAQLQPQPPEDNEEQLRQVDVQHLEDEDRPDKIKQILASITDLQLYRVTEKHHEKLETEIKDDVKKICESFLTEGRGTELNFQETMLTGGNQGLAASRLLLKSVLHGSIWECRMFWNTLTKTQVNSQYLITLLKQDVEEEGILQHRYHLRVQSRNMKMPNSGLISDFYIKLTIIMIEPEHEDITGESNNHDREVEIHELLKRRSSDTDKTNISIVYGAAGTGKTTIVQKIIHDWATGMKYEEFRFVLQFKIQKLNGIKGRITLNKLIVDAYPYLENYLVDLWKEPKRLLFIFDDLDQLHRSFIFTDNERSSDPRHRCTGPESNCLVNDILRCLLQGEILKGCSVLITARLWKQETLRHIIVDSTFKVIGFTFEKVEEYICRYLRHGQYAKDIVQFIEQNDILQSVHNNPLVCYSLASSLEFGQALGEDQTKMPVINHTQVLFDYVLILLRQCGYDDQMARKFLLEVGKLAYNAVIRNTLSFEAGALSELDICPPNFTSTFMIQAPYKQNCGLVYEFRHSVVRDFLAALAKILNTPTAQLKGLLDAQFTDTTGSFRAFTLFLVGLSSQKLTDCLKLELGSVPSEVTLCTSEWFTKSVKRRLTDMDGEYAQNMFLHILYCLLEFGDNIIMKEVLAPIATIKLNQRLTFSDCTILSRTLIYSEAIEELDLSSSRAQPEEIQKLGPILHRCVILRLNQKNLQDSGVKHVFKILETNDCKIQTLELKSNQLTDNCLGELFSALLTNRSLTQLNLSNSSQDGQHNNQFTHETLKHHVDNYAQQKEIRLFRYEPTGLDTRSNLLNLITE